MAKATADAGVMGAVASDTLDLPARLAGESMNIVGAMVLVIGISGLTASG